MKPLPIFNEMPRLVKQTICDHVDAVSKLSLRQCSKELKTLTDKSDIHLFRLAVEVYEEKIRIVQNTEDSSSSVLYLDYEQDQDKYFVKNDEKGYRKLGECADAMHGAVEQVRKIIKDRKVFLKGFTVQFRMDEMETVRKYYSKLLELLGNALESARKISVHTFDVPYVDCEQPLANILRRFHSVQTIDMAKVDEIWLDYDNKEHNELALNIITELEQWKRARRFDGYFIWAGDFREGFEKWKHFEKVNIPIKDVSVSILRAIIENFFNNPSHKFYEIACEIKGSADEQEILDFLGQFEEDSGWRIPVPGMPEEFVTVFFGDYYCYITQEF